MIVVAFVGDTETQFLEDGYAKDVINTLFVQLAFYGAVIPLQVCRRFTRTEKYLTRGNLSAGRHS